MSYLRTPDSCFDNLVDFPYEPHYVNLPSSNPFRMAYIDERTNNYNINKSATFLCLHGVPTWSYLYRKIISHLLKVYSQSNMNGCRVIAPDWIGWGRSDKPTDKSVHTISFHRKSGIELISYLKLNNITMICQDWGGLIGLTLPQYYTKYSVSNNKVIKIDNNPIKRVILFNTGMPNGTPMTAGFMKWRAFNYKVQQNNIDIKISQVVSQLCPDMTVDEANGYDMPFPNIKYKVACSQWPLNVPIHPDSNGTDLFRKVIQFWELNKRDNSIELFQGHGFNDPVMSINVAKNVHFGMFLNGYNWKRNICWSPNGSHFFQESNDIGYVINKGLKRFGDIKEDSVEYEWLVRKDKNGKYICDIVLIMINNPPVNVLTVDVAKGIMNVFNEMDSNDKCKGYIITTKEHKRKNGKPNIFGAGFDISVFAQNGTFSNIYNHIDIKPVTYIRI